MTRLRVGAGAALALVTLWGCGGAPPPDRPPLALLVAAEAARTSTTEDRAAALERVVEARARWPMDPALAAVEGHLRAELGDWSGAIDGYLDAIERGDRDPALRTAAWRAIEASDSWGRWRMFAETDDPSSRAKTPERARALLVLAGTQLEAARAAVLDALSETPGDPALLAAGGLIELRAGQFGSALLFATRARDEADETGVAPPSPTLTVLALALAEAAPERAIEAFRDARAEGLPAAVRAEARLLVRHDRVEDANMLLADWLARYPLDHETAALHGRLGETMALIAEGEAR